MEPFARTIDAAKKYVVSSTLERVDWNAELVRGDIGQAVQRLKQEAGKGLFVGGVKLPLALAELGLIDEYEFVVHPRLVGHGPTLFAGLSKRIDLKLVSRLGFRRLRMLRVRAGRLSAIPTHPCGSALEWRLRTQST
jgi:dihydrofolate reductase